MFFMIINLKTLKADFDSLISLLQEPYVRRNIRKTGNRLYQNRLTILKQIEPIYEILKDKFQIIDVYLRNNPESSVAKYIKNRVNEMTHVNKIETCRNRYDYVSNLYLVGLNFSESMIDNREEFRYSTDSEKGINRNYMRKCRNQALVELISFTKELQNFLLIMNNGFVEYPTDYNNKKRIINLTYIADYEKLSKCFSNIRKSGNYFCYIYEDKKKELSKKK